MAQRALLLGDGLELTIDVKPLLDRLKHLPDKVQNKALRQAARKGAQIQRQFLIASTPRQYGLLAKAWRVRPVRYRVQGVVGFKVRVDSKMVRYEYTSQNGKTRAITERTYEKYASQGKIAEDAAAKKKRRIRPVKYAHLVEFGHELRRKTKGASYGRVSGRHFATRVLQATTTTVNNIFAKTLKAFLEGETQK